MKSSVLNIKSVEIIELPRIESMDDKENLLNKTHNKKKFEISQTSKYDINLLDQLNAEPQEAKNLKYWKFIQSTDTGYIYLKIFYNNELNKHSSSIIINKDKSGVTLSKSVFEKDFYRFKIAQSSDNFISMTDDMLLLLGSLQNTNLKEFTLKDMAEDRCHIRCVDISPKGDYVFYTNSNTLHILNNKFNEIGNFKIPITNLSIKQYNKNSKYCSCLGIYNNASYDDIKKAFRVSIKKYHPDLNKNDPSALEKTREIINAYEQLTGRKAKEVIDEECGQNNIYSTILAQFSINISGSSEKIAVGIGFSFPGLGEDWIYATHVSRNYNYIYLGCYSGKVFYISKDGDIIKIFNCHDTINHIEELHDYLFIRSDRGLYIFKNSSYICSFNSMDIGHLKILKNYIVFINTKDISIYTLNGEKIGSIKFKDSIIDAFERDDDINIITKKILYNVRIKDNQL